MSVVNQTWPQSWTALNQELSVTTWVILTASVDVHDHHSCSLMGRCWPLSRLREPQDVSRMPDEDRGQLRIPWACLGYVIGHCGLVVMFGHELMGSGRC